MAEANPSLVFEQLRFLSDRFVRDWKKDKQPEIETYLQQVPEASQTTLLRNLLLAEVEQRRRRQEDPQVEEYLGRFPNDESTVRQVFSCSMTVSVQARAEKQDTSVGPDALSATEVLTAIPSTQLGNYLLIGELGRGGFGVVWEAEHVEQRYRVALKTLPSDLEHRLTSHAAADRLHKFRQEFRHLRDVNHPNLVGMQNLECDGLQWFLTMDLVKGVDFMSFVRPRGMLDETRLRSAFAQLVAGVAELHRRNIVHRDLKPSNVMVSHEGQVVILDFGLVVDLDQRHVSQTQIHFAGTPNYAAPEQLDSEPTPASDWYAVGTMLYEALTSQLPYSDSNPYTLMRRKSEEEPPGIEDEDLPEDLVALAIQLLQQNAQQRPAGSELAKLFELESIPQPAMGETLIGRDSQLAELGAALSQVETRQQPLAVFVSGRSGEGKSALVDRFLSSLHDDQRFTVLSGRCYDRESVPFKALDNLIDALCTHLRRLDERAAVLIPDDINFLVSLFPVMKRVNVIAEAAAMQGPIEVDDQQVRQRGFAALRALLKRLTHKKLAILFADDLQWGDGDGAEALFEVLRPPEAPKVLFVGSYRAEAADGGFLTEWRRNQEASTLPLKQEEIAVGALTVEECRELITAELPIEISESVLEDLFEEAGGNPFLLTELLGCVNVSTGDFERIPLGEVIFRKLHRLPREAADLLNIICVSGQELDLREAVQALHLDAQATVTSTHMRNERLVRVSGVGEELVVDTYHDKIRETVLSRLEGADRRGLHRTLADTIESGAVDDFSMLAKSIGEFGPSDEPAFEKTIPRLFDLSYHYEQAGEQQKALVYGLLAAEQSRKQYALDVAVEQYAIAERHAVDLASDATRFRLARGYGETLMLLGRYDEAASKLDGVIELVGDAVGKASVEAIQSKIAYQQSELNTAIGFAESGLRRLGVHVPRTWFGFGSGVCWQTFVQLLHSVFPRRLSRRKSDSQQALINHLFNHVAPEYGFLNMLKMMWALLAGMNRAERFPPSKELAFNYALQAGVVTMIGWYSRGLKYAERSIELRTDFNDEWGLGHSYSWRGIGLYASGQFREGIESLDKAIEHYSRTGDPWEINMARFHRGCCHFRLGNLTDAVADAHATYESSVRIGDSRSHCSLLLWSRSLRGDLPFDDLESRLELATQEVMSTCNLMIGKGCWQLFNGDSENAIATLEQAWDRSLRNIMINFHTVAALPFLVSAYRTRAEEVANSEPALCEKLRKRGLRLAKRAAWLTRLFPADRPHALRELGLMYAAQGRLRKSLRYLDRSCQVADKLQAKYDKALSTHARAKLAQQMKLSGAEHDLQLAREELVTFDELRQTIVEETIAIRSGRIENASSSAKK